MHNDGGRFRIRFCVAAAVFFGLTSDGMMKPAPASALPPPTSAPATEPETAEHDPNHADVQGMTISCHTWGWEWGTDDMVASMRELHEMGVTWIAIHPYGGIRKTGMVSSRRLEPGDQTDWLTRPIREAHRLGLRIMIKPHLAHWGSGFNWRGAIEFDTDEQWERFFTSYERWIVRLAEICSEADAFVVGTELDRTISYQQQWREIISAVRGQFAGQMTYAANWDSYDKVGFWDALDVVGIQAYFPLVDDPERELSASMLDASWGRIMQELRAFGKKVDRHITFTELGYNESSRAALAPWESRQGGPNAVDVQGLCLDSALRAIEAEPTVCGAFLWKWFPGSPTRGNFALARPGPRRVIRDNWLAQPPETQPDQPAPVDQ